MKRIILFLFLTGLFLPMVSKAQRRTIEGIVKDVTGPLPGVAIMEKSRLTNGVLTDENGQFSFTFTGEAPHILVIKIVGYVDQELTVTGQEWLEVIMQQNMQELEEVIVVGFGTTKRITNTGAVSSIKADEIRNVPTANVQNTLAGRVPGFFSQQRGGQPGRDASDYFIRGVSSLNPAGNRPLIIVDDIEYTYEQLSQINVNEIESISILKDASTTAIYGIKGANGVLVVTTRRGSEGKPRVNLRMESGIQQPVLKPEFLNSYETAFLRNEALSNDRLLPEFTEEDLELFRTGEDPYGHPDVNWYDVVFKPYSLQANTNVDISGGTEAVKYFISGGYLAQNGLIRDFSNERAEVNSNYYFRRYNFRSNLDIQATPSLTFRLDATGRFGEINEPGSSVIFAPSVTQNVMAEILNFNITRPYAAPVRNPDGSYAWAFGTPRGLPTINARLATKGYYRTRRSDFNLLFGGEQKLEVLTQGLSLEARVAYASTVDLVRTLTRTNPPAYHYDPEDGSYTLDPASVESNNRQRLDPFNLGSGNNLAEKRVNVVAYLNYDRTFGDHRVYSMAQMNSTSFTNRERVPENFRGYTLRLGYDYKQKYLFEFNAGYNGSDRFQASERYGFFPAFSAGWNIAEEPFFKERVDFVNLLKIRGSYGLVGSDVVPAGRYLYEQVYNRGGGYSFGETAAGEDPNVIGIVEGALGNDNVTWEKKKSIDIGLDLNMFNDKFSLTVDYFNDVRYDQLVYRGSVSSILGIGFSPTNVARVRNRGWDGQISYRNNIGQVQYNATGVFSFAKNKILFQDEAAPRYPWLARTGHSIGQPFGYTWIGFYENEADVAESAKPEIAGIQPGDLKYKDLNGDGIINESDMGPIGKPNLPNTTAGLTLGMGYKGFSLSVLFQGSTGYSFRVIGMGIEPFRGQLQPIHRERWRPATSESARFPRMTSNPSGINSSEAFPSSFWLLDVQYLRLKTVEMGYQLPSRWLPLDISNARLYLSAYNLLTWTNYDFYQQDPEVASGSVGDAYLNQRIINLGLQIGF